MEHITIDATERSPLVDFDFTGGKLRLEGEAYPEDAASFFGPLMQALGQFLEEEAARDVEFDVALAYFNSSSAKALMNIFMLMEDAAEAGHRITIRWHYIEGDDTLQEAGDDFAADFVKARFEMVEKPAA